jgi:fused signal recognition particle receptor
MAKEKKRGFFSWLGFGQKEQETEQQVEEQQAVEAQPEPETPVEAVAEPAAEEHAHTKEETEAFAEELVDVTEQVQESEKPQPVEPEHVAEAEPAVEPEPVVKPEPITSAVEETPQAVIEHEALPLPEEVTAEETSAEEWQAEAETVEIIDAVEEEAETEPELTDEELEAQALAAEAAEEAVIVVPVEETEEEAVEEDVVQEQEKPTKEGFFARLKRSLLKTKENLGSGFISLFRGKKIDDDLFEELEEQLLIADVGVETTRKIIANLTEGASRKQLRDAEALYGLLKDEMGEILAKVDEPLNIEGKTPFVILMVGVNGVGKTTTIGKLARQFEQQGKSVMLAAGDTFRAAAVEQLQVWGQRNNIPVIAQHTGADSALACRYYGNNQPSAPRSQVPFAWAPGWNSPQAWNKFQAEVGGSLRHGDPGVRLIEASETGLDFFSTVPASFQAQEGNWRIAPYYHLFGSDEMSQRSPVFQTRMPQPYIKLNPADAAKLGVNAGANIAFSYDGQTISLPLIISEGLSAGQVGLPMGMPGIAPVLAGARLDNLQEAKA